MVVWGHEHVPEDDDDYVKGVEEWIKVAEAVSHALTLACVFRCSGRCQSIGRAVLPGCGWVY